MGFLVRLIFPYFSNLFIVLFYVFNSWSTSDLRSQCHVTLTNTGRRELKGTASVRQALYEARSGIVGAHIEIQELKMRGRYQCYFLRSQCYITHTGKSVLSRYTNTNNRPFVAKNSELNSELNYYVPSPRTEPAKGSLHYRGSVLFCV